MDGTVTRSPSDRGARESGRLSVGVIGLGSIGRRHARLLAERPDVAVVWGFDTDPAASDDLDGVRAVTTVAELLATCDGVVIAAPDALHAPLTIAACEAGVPALVEKPVSDSLAAAGEMAEAAAAARVAVLVGHVLRHLPVLRRADELLRRGAIGTPLSFHAALGAYETLEVARTRFSAADRYRLPYDYTHEWHYVQWLLGPVGRVVAAAHLGGDLPLRQDPNVVDALLELEGGASGSVHLDYVERDGAREIRILGDAGVLSADLRDGSLSLGDREGTVEREHHAESRDATFRRQLDHFVDVIGGAAPAVTIAEARRALAVAEAVVASCEQRAWVAVAP